jgi:hypothetical protein
MLNWILSALAVAAGACGRKSVGEMLAKSLVV